MESLTNRDYVLSLIEESIPEPITFTTYPKSASYLLNLRRRVNEKIKEYADCNRAPGLDVK